MGLMHQMDIIPLPLQTGSSFIYHGPRTHDGLLFDPQDAQESTKTLELVNRMIGDLDKLMNPNSCGVYTLRHQSSKELETV